MTNSTLIYNWYHSLWLRTALIRHFFARNDVFNSAMSSSSPWWYYRSSCATCDSSSSVWCFIDSISTAAGATPRTDAALHIDKLYGISYAIYKLSSILVRAKFTLPPTIHCSTVLYSNGGGSVSIAHSLMMSTHLSTAAATATASYSSCRRILPAWQVCCCCRLSRQASKQDKQTSETTPDEIYTARHVGVVVSGVQR